MTKTYDISAEEAAERIKGVLKAFDIDVICEGGPIVVLFPDGAFCSSFQFFLDTKKT